MPAIFGQYIGLTTTLFVIILAARQMGNIFARFKLPLISGFLFVGIIVGPFVLDFVHTENIAQFLLLDELSLAFIAFAAGAELELHVIRGHLRSIIGIISGQVIAVFIIGVVAFLLLQDVIPFMVGLPTREIVAIALLGTTIMIARSPSSALAIIKELRARGPFTHKVLGATVLKDAVVIIIFSATVSVAGVLIDGTPFEIGLIFFVLIEIGLDILLGLAVGLLLIQVIRLPWFYVRSGLILLLGLGVFTLSTTLHHTHFFSLPISLFSEPLLICMTAGFYVTNYSRLAADFRHTIETMSPAIFLLFFTLVGIELELDVINQAWWLILILFAVRLVGIFIGSFSGTLLAGDRSPGNALLGFGFITQAGVSVGLAKEVGVEFSSWGSELATLSIGVIVVNQIVGPPLLKWAINRVGESHTRAPAHEFDGVRDAIIFGVEGQSLALARHLTNHDWQVQLVAYRQPQPLLSENPPSVVDLSDITLENLQKLQLAHADSVVLLLPDEDSLLLCELIYENFGIRNVIVRLQDRTNFERFHELGALVVEPGTAMVSLLDQFVRSPFAASLLLGMNPDEEFMELTVTNPDFHGVAIRDIHFPDDILILTVMRSGGRVVSHGYTRLALGDELTVVGSQDSLAEVIARLEG